MSGDGGEIRYAAHGDAHLAYRTWGSGPPLLYVPSQFIPIVAMDEDPTYQRFLVGLARFATLIVFDRQGIGLSDPMHAPPTVDDWADQLVSVLDATGHDSAYLLAHAWGGLPAVTLAATKPDRVRGLVLALAAVAAMSPASGSIDAMVASARPSEPASSFDFLQFLAPSRVEDPAFRRWWSNAGQRGASPAVAQQLLKLQATADVRDLTSHVEVPTLVITRTGTNQLLATAPFGLQIPDARVVDVAGVDVLLWLPDSNAVVAEVEEFMTGARQPTVANRRLCAVMFTDVVASTTSAARLGDDRWRDVLEAHDRVLRAELARHGGTEIDTAGDGFLATFATPTDAVRCAARLHHAITALGIQLRIGLHCGEVEVRANNIAGIAVHLAARVQASAQPGETWTTSTVREATIGTDARFTCQGEFDLKGVPDRWTLYRVEL